MKYLANQRGVTLLESMVAASLVAVVTYYLVTGVSNTFSHSGYLNERLMANQIVQERISKIKSLAGYYLAVVDSGNNPGFFVGCFNRRGVAVPTSSGKEGEAVVFGEVFGKETSHCKDADFEVQFQVDDKDSALLHSYVLLRRAAKNGVRQQHRTMRLERVL